MDTEGASVNKDEENIENTGRMMLRAARMIHSDTNHNIHGWANSHLGYIIGVETDNLQSIRSSNRCYNSERLDCMETC